MQPPGAAARRSRPAQPPGAAAREARPTRAYRSWLRKYIAGVIPVSRRNAATNALADS